MHTAGANHLYLDCFKQTETNTDSKVTLIVEENVFPPLKQTLLFLWSLLQKKAFHRHLVMYIPKESQ